MNRGSFAVARAVALSAALALGQIAAVPTVTAAPMKAQVSQAVESDAPGVVKTLSLVPLAPESSVAVRPFDDSDANLMIKRRFEEELAEARRPLSDDARLVLSFETAVLEGRFPKDGGTLGSLQAGSQETRLDLNVWSTTKDSVLGGRQARDPRRANVVHMNAVLRDTRSGKTVWQGDAYSKLIGGDALRVARSMVRPLVANLGRTVTNEPFEIE
jgi:hypothetical protein